jgi:nicotinamidase-related amidase
MGLNPSWIRGTVTDALSYDYQVMALSDAIAAQTQAVQEANLYDMKNMGACQHTKSRGFFKSVLIT